MRRVLCVLFLMLGSCSLRDSRTPLLVQRFFGDCDSPSLTSSDRNSADSECVIITALINEFRRRNPDINLKVNVVAWPGYDQLTAQLAVGSPPDLVTMHASVIPDYQARKLLAPIGKLLLTAGIRPEDLTPAARPATTIDGEIYALPFDTWAPLWHINVNLFKRAGLTSNGRIILPTSPKELLAHAERFKRRTGKPYFVQAQANEYPTYARNLFTFLMQQNANLFSDPRHVKLDSREARNVLRLFRTLYVRDFTTKNQDYSAATASFLNGEGGVFLTGTWMVGQLDRESYVRGSPLYLGYEVVPYPQLYHARQAIYTDGHSWVMPTDRVRPRAVEQAALRFLLFIAANDSRWGRTGHVPAFRAALLDRAYSKLPHRKELSKISQIGVSLPAAIRRRMAIEKIVGEESAAGISGTKHVDEALLDAEMRINDLLKRI